MDKIKALLKNSPWVIAVTYIAIGLTWILFSDQWVLYILDDPEKITTAQSYKGWFFVLASGLLIFVLIQASNQQINKIISELRFSNQKFKATIHHAPLGIAHHYPNEKWMEVNHTLCNMLGYNREELLKLDFPDFIHPDDLDKGRDFDQNLINKSLNRFSLEKTYLRKDGSEFTGLVHKSAVHNGDDNPPYIIAMLEDITDRKKREAQIIAALKEKEVLLAEIQHRVRNNLALISAFIDLESDLFESPEIRKVIDKHKTRIKCLALVHEEFSSQDKSADVRFNLLLPDLFSFITAAYYPRSNGDAFTIDFQDVTLNINLAIPVCLLLTEILVYNSHDLPDQVSNPVYHFALNEDDNNRVTISIGSDQLQLSEPMGEKGDSPITATILQALLSQIDGELTPVKSGSHTELRLSFQNIVMKGPGSSLYQSQN
jgi:PAS domain S-box-containing protein